MAKKKTLNEMFDETKLAKLQKLAGVIDGVSIELNDTVNDPAYSTDFDLRKRINAVDKALTKLCAFLGY